MRGKQRSPFQRVCVSGWLTKWFERIRKEYMLATLEMLRETYGSVESYVVDLCRVPRETIERIRRCLIVDVHAGDEPPIDWTSHAELVQAQYQVG